MRDALIVGAGGFAGSIARFLLSGWITQLTTASRFPAGTLAVNTIGCLCIGGMSAYAEQTHLLSPHLRLLLFTGVLGGFTTFSAFAYESWFLGREHDWLLASASVLLHVAVALGAVWIGHTSVQLALR